MTAREGGFAFAGLLLANVVARAMPHAANFAPVAASGLFLGAYCGPRRAVPFTLAILLISDYALLYVNPYHTHLNTIYAPWRLWYGTSQLFVYASFLISALVGKALSVHRSPTTVAVAGLFCSLQFFFITNAGTWVEGYYPRGLHGLYDAYVAGLPFFRNTVAGDLVYAAAFFGCYEIIRVFREAAAPARVALGR